jgi:tRNA pseudouridine55 synthase
MKSAEYHGLLVVDKRSGMTSRDVVNRVQGWFPRFTRIGHTGTLDPLATGVLVVCVGVATRLAEYVQRMPKTYRTGILLGSRSDTDDADGTIVHLSLTGPPPDRMRVLECLQGFIGEIDQVPPAYSAAKVGGRRAYDLARRGHDVELQPRRVTIYRIDVLAYEYPHLDVEVHCGKGTYIRSLARELGERLGCGALVETLRRTAVGPFETVDAIRVEADRETARASLLPIAAAVRDLTHISMEDALIQRLRLGQSVPLPEDSGAGSIQEGEELAVLDSVGNLVAVAILGTDGLVQPAKVFS